MRDGFATALIDLMASDPRVYVLDGDVANSTRVDRVFEKHPDRVISIGIAEQNMVSVGAGLASVGLRPVVTTFAAFAASRCLDQIRVQVAQPGLPVTIVGAYAGLLAGKTGKTHIAVDDLSVFRSMPGMRVLAPVDEAELAQMLKYAVEAVGPTYIRVARDPVPQVVGNDYAFSPTRIVNLVTGSAIVIVSTGAQSARCLAAAQLLKRHGVSPTVVHVPAVKPLPSTAILGVIGEASLVVTVEENNKYGGLGSAIAELVAADVSSPALVSIGIDDCFAESAANEDLLAKYGLGEVEVAERIGEAMARAQVVSVAP